MHIRRGQKGLRSDLASKFFPPRPFARWEPFRLRNDTCHPVPLLSEAFSAPDYWALGEALTCMLPIPTDDAGEEPLKNKIEQNILAQVGAQGSQRDSDSNNRGFVGSCLRNRHDTGG
jgi:hypothetical protein